MRNTCRYCTLLVAACVSDVPSASSSTSDSPSISDVVAEADPPASVGASAREPAESTDSDCENYEVRARHAGGEAPYRVAAGVGDDYRCFVFDLKLDGKTQAVAFYPIQDNTQIVHHFLLYRHDALDTSKAEIDCDTLSADAVVLAGWAPGSSDWVLPDEVGMDLGPGRFVLEVHYSNPAETAVTDRSGMRICATRTPRPNTATVSWLGNQFFAIPAHATNYQVQGRCTPWSSQPIHVLRTWPHMHALGKRMSVRVDRADGSRTMIHDQPFSFADQKHYDTPFVLQPGDSLLTTCYFDNPHDRFVGLGTRTSDEMCHNFVVAYPAGALASPGLLANSCIGLP